MEITVEALTKIFVLGGLFVGFIGWFIRLEAKVMYLEKDHEKHKLLVKENEKKIWEKVEELQSDTKKVLLTLARIEESIKYINRKDH